MGLNEGNGQDELKKAYKTLSSRYHPDKFVHMKPEIVEAMKQETQVVQAGGDNFPYPR